MHLEHSRSYSVSVEDAYDRTLTAPLEGIFGSRYLIVPAISRVDPTGVWGDGGVGQRRTLHLSDRGTLRETLTELDRPHAFGYELDEVRGAMRLLTTAVRGRWSFAPVGTSTRITWSWDLEPAHAASRLVMPLFRTSWLGAARRTFTRLEPHLLD